jgi:hypothetical protein
MLFSMEWLGWEASNPKAQAPEKFQAPNLNAPPGWSPHHSGFGLELEIWSFSGAWCLGFGVLVRGAFHGK